MQRRQQTVDMYQQFQILKGDFIDEDKENAVRKIIQIAQPKLYEQRLQQDPNAKFYQKRKTTDPIDRAGLSRWRWQLDAIS